MSFALLNSILSYDVYEQSVTLKDIMLDLHAVSFFFTER